LSPGLLKAQGTRLVAGRDFTWQDVRGPRSVVLVSENMARENTVDFLLSGNRDMNSAKSFLRSAMKNTRVPTKITSDAYAASHRAVREMKEDGELPRRVKFDPASS